MAKQGLERIKAIFVEAVEKTGAERDAFVHQACADDAELLAEVEAFLSASERAGNFLESPTADTSGDPAAAGHSSGERVGSIIGQCKLLELIGEGGFGSVFMAEQEGPFRRKVALKIIKLGMDSKQVIARFEAERQALAMMDHPNIAKVFEAGATETGRPYIVMELVRGVPITQYCDSQKLTTEQRAQLFIQVCQAVQHAHQKGVIHRDIKPNNVLVTMRDDKPVPKIIDFGIAKATTGQRLTDKTLFTEFRQFVGTPAYMSPEQAQMNELDVDTRSDIYSLGVLFYELLTGTTPFDPKELRSAAYEEIRRIIREEEPPTPSARISSLSATLPTIAGNRRVDPSKLVHGIRGELDWIVMKAMEKDRTRRYETANALALDIRRHLNNEPILARPTSAAYRFRKWVARNKLVFGAVGAVALALITGICISTLEAVRANRAREMAQAALADARAQRDEAVKQRQIAAAVNNFLADMISKADPRTARLNVTVAQAIDSAVKLLDAGAMKDQPLVEASLRLTIAKAQSDLQIDSARRNLKRSIELYRQVWPDDPLGLAQALLESGRIENAGDNYGQTQQTLREALRIFTTTSGASDKDIAYCLNALATSLSGLGNSNDADPMALRALAMFRKQGNASDLAWSLVQTSGVLDREGKYSEAEQLIREALQLGRRSLSPDSTTLKWIVARAVGILRDEGKYADAEPLCREELAITRRVCPPGDGKIIGAMEDYAGLLVDERDFGGAEREMTQCVTVARTYQADNDQLVGEALLNLGWVLMGEQKFAQSESFLRQALSLFHGSKTTVGPAQTCNALCDLAYDLRCGRRYSESESLLRQALELDQQAYPPGDWTTIHTMEDLGSLLGDEGKFDEAEEDLKGSVAMAHTFHPHSDAEIGGLVVSLSYMLMQDQKNAEAESTWREALGLLQNAKTTYCLNRKSNALSGLGDDLRDEAKYSESESLLKQAMEFDKTIYALDSAAIGSDLIDLGLTMDDAKEFAGAESIDRKALAIYNNVNPPDAVDVANAEENLGDVLCEEGRYAQSEPLLRHALGVLNKNLGISDGRTRDTAAYLAILFDKTHRASEAASLRRQFVLNPSTEPTATEPAAGRQNP
jgi:hypothetical protein